MTSRAVLGALALAWLPLGGCAGYELAPLTAAHPAHLDAPAALPRSPSRTLAYTAADLPSAAPTPSLAVAPEPMPRGTPPGSGSRTVVGEGEVVSTVPRSGQIVVDHEEIKGFMEAMTMGYRVEPASLLADVKEGDKIRFTIDVQRRAIVGIEKLK